MINFSNQNPSWVKFLTLTTDLQNEDSTASGIVTGLRQITLNANVVLDIKPGAKIKLSDNELTVLKSELISTQTVLDLENTLSLAIETPVTISYRRKNWYGKAVEALPTLAGDPVITAEQNQKITDVFDRAYGLYGSYKETTASIKSGVKSLADDLSQLGAKMIILEPFGGYMEDLRYQVTEALSNTYPNYPKISQNTAAGSFTMVFRVSRTAVSTTADFLDKFSVLISLMYTFFNSNSGDFNALIPLLSNWYNQPLTSPFREIFSDDIVTAMQQDELSNFLASQQGIATTTVSAVSQLNTDITSQLSESLKSLGSFGKAIDTSIKNFNGNPLDFLQEASNTYLPALTDTLLNTPVGRIKEEAVNPFTQYEVFSENTSGTVTYNGSIYYAGNLLVGVKGVSSFQSAGGAWIEKIQEPSISDLADALGGWLGPQDETMPETAKTTDLFGSENSKIDPEDIVNNWYSLTSIEQLGGSAVSGFINAASQVIQNTTTVADGAADSIFASLQWVSDIRQTAVDNQNSGKQILQGLADLLPSKLELIDVDVFVVPPQKGGLHRIRYIHNEWFSGEAPNTPVYEDFSVFLPVILVYNDGAVLSRLGDLFKEKQS